MKKQDSFKCVDESIMHSSGESIDYPQTMAWDMGYEHGLEEGYRNAMKAIGKAATEVGSRFANRDQTSYSRIVLNSYTTVE